MAKTTSEIVAENMKKREEEQKIAESREKIHQQQMAELEEIKKNHTTIESTAQPQYLPIETGLIGGAIGFLLGFLLAALFFMRKVKSVKKDCASRIEEVRASMDRMLLITSNARADNTQQK